MLVFPSLPRAPLLELGLAHRGHLLLQQHEGGVVRELVETHTVSSASSRQQQSVPSRMPRARVPVFELLRREERCIQLHSHLFPHEVPRHRAFDQHVSARIGVENYWSVSA